MVCQRCRGLLLREIFVELSAEAGITFLATRCINCGYIEDFVVRANRLHPPRVKQSMSRCIVKKEGVVFLQSHPERARFGIS
jgi:RNase P subunit RPR2